MRARPSLPGPRVALAAAILLVTFAASCTEPSAEPAPARLLERVRHQVAQGPRISGTAGNTAVRTWIVAEVTRLGGRAEQQAFSDTVAGKVWPLVNVIGRFGPATGRRIAFFAHFDTRPWSDQEPVIADRDTPCPGANDAGSGVAVLLELAEMMQRRSPAVGVDLVFLDGEDFGRETAPEEYCRGSLGYAKRLPPAGDPARPIAGFLFDMVGDKDLGIWDEGNSAARATNLVELVHEAARATGARSFHPEVRYTIIDDHVPLLDAGLPCVDIIDFDYPAWHTTRDLPEQVSGESMAEVARLGGWIIYSSVLGRK